MPLLFISKDYVTKFRAIDSLSISSDNLVASKCPKDLTDEFRVLIKVVHDLVTINYVKPALSNLLQLLNNCALTACYPSREPNHTHLGSQVQEKYRDCLYR